MITENLARILALLGILLLTAAGIVYLAGRLDVPLGKLPGDISIKRENFKIQIPITSSILVSILITLVLNVLIRLFR